MLEMRPDCERCGVGLAIDAAGAWICSFECTFCESCAIGELSKTCPNCGGVLLPRPPRPTAKLVSYEAAARRHLPAKGATGN